MNLDYRCVVRVVSVHVITLSYVPSAPISYVPSHIPTYVPTRSMSHPFFFHIPSYVPHASCAPYAPHMLTLYPSYAPMSLAMVPMFLPCPTPWTPVTPGPCPIYPPHDMSRVTPQNVMKYHALECCGFPILSR